MTRWIAMLLLAAWPALVAASPAAPVAEVPPLPGPPPVEGAPPGPHAAQAADPPVQWAPRITRRPLPEPTPGPDVTVYGYQAWWAADLGAIPWDHLSHLAVFSAGAQPDGSLTHTDRWSDAADAVAMAEPYGVRVHLCVTNFSTSQLGDLLGSPTARQTLIDHLASWVDTTGAHGVNVDFEGVPGSRRAEMVAFVADLADEVGEVVLATPAVDWVDAWDYAALTDDADLFIMGYGYHWSGSEYAGPVDPLYGGDPWAQWSLAWTVDDYLASGADPDRVILGLPLYGYVWPTVDGTMPSRATSDAVSITWVNAQAKAAAHGRAFDPVSRTPWWYDGAEQGWYGDTDSLRERVRYAVDADLGGIGFWALHYDDGDAALWEMVATETTSDDPGPDDTGDPGTDDPSGYHAEVGNPFLAYPGDIAVLSGANSTGPGELQYEWTQVAGPAVALDDPAAMDPAFAVREPGTHAFELRVGDGETWSEPATSYVVVIEAAAGRRYKACGCATGGAGGWAWLLPLALLWRWRRGAGAERSR